MIKRLSQAMGMALVSRNFAKLCLPVWPAFRSDVQKIGKGSKSDWGTQTWTLPPDQRVLILLYPRKPQNKLCGVWILFSYLRGCKNWDKWWMYSNAHPPDWCYILCYIIWRIPFQLICSVLSKTASRTMTGRYWHVLAYLSIIIHIRQHSSDSTFTLKF